MEACPHCGGAVAAFGVYKHRWWTCVSCGCATREPRPVLPAQRLPAFLRSRLPAALLRDPEVTAAPGTAFFLSDGDTAAAREVADVRRWLSDAGIRPEGRVLDVGGGPGFVAADLMKDADVVLLEHSPHAVSAARSRGVDARPFDFAGPTLRATVEGRFTLILVRYSLGWCRDLPRFVDDVATILAPGGALLLTFVTPSVGAFLGSALEDAAPAVLWDGTYVARVLASIGWRCDPPFVPTPALLLSDAHGRPFRALSVPWRLQPTGSSRDLRQHHLGLIARRA